MRVAADDVEDDGGLVFHQGEPFTGEVVEQGPDGSLATLYTYDTGTEDGPYREWYPDDRPYKEGTMRMGLPVGLHRRWHPNGVLAEETLFGDHADHLGHRKWDENGNLLVDTLPPTP
jgi:antitoxin component YwqK of YwqJK toxin-antitoxin module